MTFEECQKALELIQSKQGTNRPLIRVDYGGASYRGLLARSDSDPAVRAKRDRPPYGVLVIDEPGLAKAPQTILQIAGISDVADG